MERKRISKSLSEENNELKQYIESLNKECMELQAALFEEANKMVTQLLDNYFQAQTAYAAEHAAVKRAEEMKKENIVSCFIIFPRLFEITVLIIIVLIYFRY